MSERSIRLNAEGAAKYGRRVLLPGTAEHAAYCRDHGIPVQMPSEATPQREVRPSESGPTVSHEVLDDGTWVVTRDDEFFADGDDVADIPEVIALAEAGHEAFAPTGGHAASEEFDSDAAGAESDESGEARAALEAMNVPDLRKLASENEVSYSGLRKDDLIDALLAAGVEA